MISKGMEFMKKYLSGQEVLQHWNIEKIELFDLVKEGLQPYSRDTGKPVPCSCTIQNRLKYIKGGLKVVNRYLDSPKNLNREQEDWLLNQNKPIQKLLKDLKNEKEMIVNELSKKKISENDKDDSWKNFYFDTPESYIKHVIQQIIGSLFLKSDIISVLGPDKKVKRDESEYYYKEKIVQSKVPESDSAIKNL